MKRIVLMSFDFECPNIEALSYAFVCMLQKLCPEEALEISNLTHKDSLGIFPEKFPDIKFVPYQN